MSTPDTPLRRPDATLHDTACPYCRRVMRWVGDGRRAGSGCFECDACGTFDVPGWVPPHLRTPLPRNSSV